MPVLPPVMIATRPARRFIALREPSADYLSSRTPRDGVGHAIERGDDGGAASTLDEVDGGLDLGPHAPGREFAGGEEAPSLTHAETVEETLTGRPPADGHAVYPGEEHDPLGAELTGEHSGRQILLDDGFHALHSRRRFQDGDAAAAHGDRHDAGVDEGADQWGLHDANRARRWNHAAPAAATVLNDVPSVVARVTLRLGLLVEGADGLGRQAEGRIALGDDDLADDRRDARGEAARGQQVAEDLLDRVTEAAFGFGDAEIERQSRHDRLRDLHPQQLLADLRPVAVGQHETVTSGDEIDEGR